MFKCCLLRSFWKPYLLKMKLELTKCLCEDCHKFLKPQTADLDVFVRLFILEASLIKEFCFSIINLYDCIFALIQSLLKSIRVTVQMKWCNDNVRVIVLWLTLSFTPTSCNSDISIKLSRFVLTKWSFN